MKFSWDLDKLVLNKKKYGIDFDQAKEVFMDYNVIVDQVKRVEGEECWFVIGKILKFFIVVIVFIIRDIMIWIILVR